MGTSTWATPVGVLAGLSVAGIVFIWWWFPRTWNKGNRQEMEAIDEDRRVRDAAISRRLEQDNANAAENGEAGTAPTEPAKTFQYRPPAYTSY